MKRTIAWLAWASIGLVAALVALNWPAMLASSTINFVFTEVQLPLGLFMLAVAAVPVALIFVAQLHQQIGTLLETRRLLREVQRAHELADKAEASRIEGLQQLMADQFRVVNERLDSLGAAVPVADDSRASPSGLTRILSGPWKSK